MATTKTNRKNTKDSTVIKMPKAVPPPAPPTIEEQLRAVEEQRAKLLAERARIEEENRNRILKDFDSRLAAFTLPASVNDLVNDSAAVGVALRFAKDSTTGAWKLMRATVAPKTTASGAPRQAAGPGVRGRPSRAEEQAAQNAGYDSVKDFRAAGSPGFTYAS